MSNNNLFRADHLLDMELTSPSDAECLDGYYQKFAWLRALLLAIQMDEDIEQGEHLYHLAQIGEHLAEAWMGQIDLQRQENEVASL